MQRRSFLALLGLSPVASAAAPDVIGGAASFSSDPFAVPQAMNTGGKYIGRATQLKRAMRMGLVTRDDIKRAHLDATRGSRYQLDHDIEAFKSFSASAKHRLQQEREAERFAEMSTIENDALSLIFKSIRDKVLGPGELD
jgi:hypothetical protein